MRLLAALALLLTACPDQGTVSVSLKPGEPSPGVKIVGCWTDYSTYTNYRCLYELDGRRGITGVGFPDQGRAGKHGFEE